MCLQHGPTTAQGASVTSVTYVTSFRFVTTFPPKEQCEAAFLSFQAYKWYELGHKRGHFASVWQRSLYNVNGLKAQPWWTPRETGYTELVKVSVSFQSSPNNLLLVESTGCGRNVTAKGIFFLSFVLYSLFLKTGFLCLTVLVAPEFAL